MFETHESKRLIDWLLERGLGVGESAFVVRDVECGHSLAWAISTVFEERKKIMERLNNEKLPNDDWGNPITA